MLAKLHRIGEVHFRLLSANGLHVKENNERFTAADSLCRQNLKNEPQDTIMKYVLLRRTQ